jgi:hypothetical protein
VLIDVRPDSICIFGVKFGWTFITKQAKRQGFGLKQGAFLHVFTALALVFVLGYRENSME